MWQNLDFQLYFGVWHGFDINVCFSVIFSPTTATLIKDTFLLLIEAPILHVALILRGPAWDFIEIFHRQTSPIRPR